MSVIVSGLYSWYFFFFFQAEDGIRDVAVTGVQTCALPIVPWPAVEVTESLPSRWTVVPRPANAVMIPATWGAHYAVCPRCRHRAPLQGRPETMQCPRCGKLSPVAWDEAYLGRK